MELEFQLSNFFYFSIDTSTPMEIAATTNNQVLSEENIGTSNDTK